MMESTLMMIIHTCRDSEASTIWDQSYDEIYIGMKGDIWTSCRISVDGVETESCGNLQLL